MGARQGPYAALVTTDGFASTRATTSGRPRPGVSTDEAPLVDALPIELLFDDGEYHEIDSADGDALLGKVGE